MIATLLLIWSVTMAAPPTNAPTPPLTEAQKKAEYEMVKVQEVLTPAQIKQRDIIPGWRPIPPKSDIEQGAVEIVPGEDNPYLIRAERRVGGNGLIPTELDQLGKPSPSPRGFRINTGAREAYWYEQIDEKGQMTGIWMAVYTLGDEVEGYVMVGRLFMGPNVFYNVEPGIDACTRALRSLKRTLSGEEPPSPAELNRRFEEKRRKMLEGR